MDIPAATTAVVDIVFPCLDEAQALPSLIALVPSGYRAIVVDNGSADGSPEVARAAGALVLHEPLRGYGAAAHAGLLGATAPVVAFCDADGSFDPRDVARLTEPVLRDEADLVLCRRRPTTARAWPPHARAANRLLSWRLRRMTGLDLHDLGPMRVARRQPLVELGLLDRRSGYPLETLLRAHAAGWRIREIDVDYTPRTGRSKVTGTVRGTATAVCDMSRLLRAAT